MLGELTSFNVAELTFGIGFSLENNGAAKTILLLIAMQPRINNGRKSVKLTRIEIGKVTYQCYFVALQQFRSQLLITE